MVNRIGKICTVFVFALLLFPAGAMAAINTIGPGNTVFLGEQGLDITAAMGGYDRIGWWASAADISNTAPSATISVASPSAFFISPSDFTGKLGPWYRLDASGKANGTAFIVADPNLDIRIYDATVNVDASSNGWITTGDSVEFHITTNLYQMGQRAGVAGAPITIKVQGPEGSIYSALINSAGTSTNIVDIPVGTSPYNTGPIWDTGRQDTYSYGTYAIWAEVDANSMKDNYGESGKTYTPSWGLLDQQSNPLIGVNTRTPSTTVPTSIPVTTKTTMVTTAPPTAQTTVTIPPTPAPTTLPSLLPTATVPTTMVPTRSPGFESVLACAAMLLVFAIVAKRE